MEARTRHEVIEAHLPLVRSLARRYAFAGEPLEDLEQVGAIGLIKAVDRFDERRRTPLAVYAAPVIAGELRHHVRDLAFPVRLPRRARRAGERVRAEAFEEAMAADAADALECVEVRLAIARAARALDDRDRRLVLLFLFADLTQSEIALRLGLSPAHACRLLRRALHTLHEELADATSVQNDAAHLAAGRLAA
jgi:RNA polymerase sigma-B factor